MTSKDKYVLSFLNRQLLSFRERKIVWYEHANSERSTVLAKLLLVYCT